MTTVPATLRLRREGVLRSRAARGDAVAFAAVYERHHQALYRYCRSILRHEEDAQDALQSTMTRAFAALQDEPRDFELRPWLFRIAHNEAISILRRRRTTTSLEDVPGDASETEDRVHSRDELRVLQLDLADLPERQRAALVLRELNGLSHAEIATVLVLSPGAVKQAIFEARTALFSCREGREMACHDVRRLLSDGDGRVLRGRGVRAHLRSCPDCRRFRADIAQRPHALRMLAPPLPTAGAAALLAELLGGTTAKLVACVAIAGGGGAVAAVEMRDPPKRAAVVTEREQTRRAPVPTPTPTPARHAEVAPAPVRSAPQEQADRSERPRAERRERRRPPRKPAAAAPIAAQDSAPAAVPVRAEAPAKPERRKADKPKRAKKEPKAPKADKPPRAKRPARAERRPPAAEPTPQAAPPAEPGPPAHAQARGREDKPEKAERRAAPPPPVPVRGDEDDEGDDEGDDGGEDDD